jgi:hypothetical protein
MVFNYAFIAMQVGFIIFNVYLVGHGQNVSYVFIALHAFTLFLLIRNIGLINRGTLTQEELHALISHDIGLVVDDPNALARALKKSEKWRPKQK